MIECKRCILTTEIPSVFLGKDGVCNYCKLHDKWEKQYYIELFSRIVKEIKQSGKNQLYNCIVGVSGGCDSSYLLMLIKNLGMRPLAVHWNNGWNTKIAEANIQKMIKGLGIDYYEITMDLKEYDDICRSFLKASVVDADIPNDIALTTCMYKAADTFNVKYLLGAHSFRTEGTTPLEWSYMDGKYVKSVHSKFGSIPMKTFPNLWLNEWVTWLDKGLKRPRLLWYLPYNKEKVKRNLTESYGWKWYGAHHAENIYTKFISNCVQPRKFNVDLRYIEYSALIRSNQLSKQRAKELMAQPLKLLFSEQSRVMSRLNLSGRDFDEIMSLPIKTYKDYETYLLTFKRLKPMFKRMLKEHKIPVTFYEKYVAS